MSIAKREEAGLECWSAVTYRSNVSHVGSGQLKADSLLDRQAQLGLHRRKRGVAGQRLRGGAGVVVSGRVRGTMGLFEG